MLVSDKSEVGMSVQAPSTETVQVPTVDQVRDGWNALATGFDDHVTPYSLAFGEQALQRLDLGPGTRLIDVAAGTGALAIPAARAGADVVAVDIAPAMIGRLAARARRERLALDARVGDGAALDFDDDAFDAAVSMNGVSVFPDLPRGLRELVRVTRPGGRVLVIAFGRLARAEFIAFFIGAIATALPGFTPPPPDPPMPQFRLSDRARMRAALDDAGLRDVQVDAVDFEMAFDSADHFVDGTLASSPIAGQLTSNLSEQQFGDIRQVLDGMLRERSGGSPGAVLHAEMNVAVGTV